MTDRELKFRTAGSKVVAFADTTTEQTGMLPGKLYRFTANGGCALVRWGASDAATADAGFDFAVGNGDSVLVRCPAGVTAVNIIELDAGSTATAAVAIAEVDEGA